MLSKVSALILLLMPFCQLASAQNNSQGNQPLVDELNTYMERLENLGYSGGLAVFKDGDVLMSQGYGDANRKQGTPFTNTSVFPVGSVTKQFTGAAIMRLVMANRVSVDDLISIYFDGVPEDKAGITVHHLLTHSAGLPDAIGYDFEAVEWDDYLLRALDSELMFEPGSGYGYSNVGFSFLAAIVESVSGQSYTDFVRDQLFEPAGMTQTGYDLSQFDAANMAHGYRQGSDWGSFADKAWADDGPYWHLRGNGGMLSTLDDLMRWHVALEGDEILSGEAKEAYFAPHVLEGPGAPSSYAYGWVNQQTERGLLIWHDGGNPYFNSDFRRYVDAGIAIFVHSNSNEYRSSRIMDPISDVVFGDPYQLPPMEAAEPSLGDRGGSPGGESTRWGVPDSPGGRVIAKFLDAVTSGDADVFTQYIQDNFAPEFRDYFPMEDHLGQFEMMHQDLGLNPEVLAAGRPDEASIRVQLKTPGGTITILFNIDSEYRIAGLQLD